MPCPAPRLLISSACLSWRWATDGPAAGSPLVLEHTLRWWAARFTSRACVPLVWLHELVLDLLLGLSPPFVVFDYRQNFVVERRAATHGERDSPAAGEVEKLEEFEIARQA